MRHSLLLQLLLLLHFFSLRSFIFTHASDLCEIYVHSRDGAQSVLQHNRLRGNDPKGGQAAEVLVAFK